eukprot:jgi/Galph1/579/GphlegSOOS_G5413.1
MVTICIASIIVKRKRREAFVYAQSQNQTFATPREGNALFSPPLSCGRFSVKLNDIAPELKYGDTNSFHQAHPKLKALFATHRQALKQKELDLESVVVESCATPSLSGGSRLSVERPAQSSVKSVLEEELICSEQEGSPHKLKTRGNILEQMTYAVYLEENDEMAAELFEDVLMKHSVCAICLEDFEIGCGIRILHCGHFFHSNCVYQWFSKSTTCPLCKKSVFVNATEIETRHCDEQHEGNMMTDSSSHGQYGLTNEGGRHEMEHINSTRQALISRRSMFSIPIV